jgi:PTS system mannitol-specific IIC component
VSDGAVRARIQRGGAFLSGMIVPNIGAFLAWGLITAIAIPGGWFPSARLAT